jgi:hypothetical protein
MSALGAKPTLKSYSPQGKARIFNPSSICI